jgi:hypothetical protein
MKIVPTIVPTQTWWNLSNIPQDTKSSGQCLATYLPNIMSPRKVNMNAK